MALSQTKYSKFMIRKDRAHELVTALREKLNYSIIMDTHNEDASEVWFIINLPFIPVRNGFQTYYRSTPTCNMRSINAKIKSVIKKFDSQDYTLGWEVSSKPKMVNDKLRVSLGYATNYYRIKVYFI